MKLLEGKTAIVTGAARGIGKAIALKLAEAGANIAFTDIALDENMNQVQEQLMSFGVKAKGYASNAANYADSEKLADEVLKDFGSIDILINNAGITRDNLLMRMTEEQWDLVINVNLKSVFNMTKACQKQMLKQKNGSIINISSVVGVGGNAGQSNYAASKAGIIGFTKSIAKELGSRNVRCNAIAPGFIVTEMTAKLPEDIVKGWYEKIPLKRGGAPEEVASVCVFLASDMASYVSGQTISVCGAMQT
ncbi:MAG TPA: 3-oxoacyl-[acyl-carrier-protein] reductase [Bacteroidales bacterium]|nr:MAG: 3-oxoacyl-[acyl-carrier-protein] reductase [Bacteroidetes bacterium GWF2_35_48]OFY94752.1 MAG: 3-oxoacyl-[acyl-carrier-protein] reductase [Bacteroidetes bacterium RIFOXYC12_FULL_35_7]HBX50305.1 3-oxoacyl-[acyl-carrier-protein] reductase [Bacteroidales bacterium]